MTGDGSIRLFFDPVTATVIATAASAGGRLVSGFAQAADQRAQAEFAEAQADQEALVRRQELEDFEKEQRRRAARANAVLAAQGADLTSGTPLAIAQSRAVETEEGLRRIRQQSRLRESSFRARASNFRRAAGFSVFSGFLGAVGAGARGGQSFLRITQTQQATGAA